MILKTEYYGAIQRRPQRAGSSGGALLRLLHLHGFADVTDEVSAQEFSAGIIVALAS